MSKIIFLLFTLVVLNTALLFAAPAAVTDLAVSDSGFKHAVLTWSTPYDTPSSTTPTYYELRISTKFEIINDTRWNNNSSLTSYPYQITWTTGGVVSGQLMTRVVTGLTNGKSYFFALKSSTDNLSWSTLDTDASPNATPINSAPSNVTYSTSLDKKTTNTVTPTLMWNASVAGDGGQDSVYGDSIVSYEIGISTAVEFPSGGVTLATSGTTQYVTWALNENTTYYWRVRALDSGGLYSPGYLTQDDRWFTINAINDPPANFDLTTIDVLGTNIWIANKRPVFEWSSSSDSDPGDYIVQYDLYYSTSSSFEVSITTVETNKTSNSPVVYDFIENATYYWKVHAIDTVGAWTVSNATEIVRIDSLAESPLAYTVTYPVNPDVVLVATPTFTWNPAVDPDPDDVVTYKVLISSSDSTLSTETSTYLSISQTQVIINSLEEDVTYWWQVQATDLDSKTTLSDKTSFYVNAISDPPNAFDLISSSGFVNSQLPLFDWQDTSDVDAESFTYTIYYSTDASFAIYESSSGLLSSSFTPTTNLDENVTYYWRVDAIDVRSTIRTSNQTWEIIIDSVEESPYSFNLSTPINGATIRNYQPLFEWEPTTDPDPLDYVGYYNLYYSTDSSLVGASTVSNIAVSTYSVIISTAFNHTTFYWQIKAVSALTGETTSQIRKFYLENDAPSSFTHITSSGVSVTDTPMLNWGDAIDPENDSVNYTLYYSLDPSFSVFETSSNITSTSYQLPSLTENLTYYWYVIAADQWGNSTQSSQIWSVHINAQDESPAAFNLISPNDGQSMNTLYPSFSWNSSSDPDIENTVVYNLWYSTDSSFSSKTNTENLTSLNYTASSKLLLGATYYWRVYAVGSDSQQRESDTRTLYTASLSAVLTSPTSNSQVNTLKPELTWNAAVDTAIDNTILYEVWYSTDISFSQRKSSSNLTELTYTISEKLILESTYYWRVYAYGNNGELDESITNSFYTVPLSVNLNDPQNGSIADTRTPMLDWNDAVDANIDNTITYVLLYSTDMAFGSKTEVDVSTNTYYNTRTNLGYATTYYWQVYAYGNNGEVDQSETWSFVLPVEVKPNPPDNFTTRLSTNGTTVVLSWDPVTANEDGSVLESLAGYKIYRADDFDSVFTVAETVSVSSSTLTWTDEKNIDQILYYVVKAYNSYDSVSEWSSIQEVSTIDSGVVYTDDRSIIVSYPKSVIPSTITVDVTRITSEEDEETVGSFLVQVRDLNQNIVDYVPAEALTFTFKISNISGAIKRRAPGDSVLSSIGVYWNNDVEWVRMNGEEKGSDIVTKAPYLGYYQLKRVAASNTFNILSTWPKIITPNSDSVNDEFVCTFENTTSNGVDGRIYDLTGACIAKMSAQTDNRLIWTGIDDNGAVVQPGVYIYQIKTGSNVFNGTVVVAR